MEAVGRFGRIIGGFIWQVNNELQDFILGPVMLSLFLIVGLWITCRTEFFQFSKFRLWIQNTILAVFRNKKVIKTKDKHAISQFQSLCLALAATIGVGNISGVAVALACGGPGAIFWMWLTAFLGMMTDYAENTLGIKYRYKNEKGEWIGGAMIYMERGLKCKWLAVIFSIFCIFASFGIGNMSQINEIANGMHHSFSIPPVVTALVVAGVVALVIIGGLKRIAAVAEKVVPFMAVLYLVCSLLVIFANVQEVPSAFGKIFAGAFRMDAAAGGAAGFALSRAVTWGIRRGVFSNEAGLGSSVIVHSTSDVKEPVIQGMWGIFEVFVDTIVVCTMTALVILTSGVYQVSDYARYADPSTTANLVPETLKSGIALTSAAFESVFGSAGGMFVSIAVMSFAFSTLLGWSFYGQQVVEYLFGVKAVSVYKVVFVGVIIVGALSSLSLVIALSDTFNGLMAIPNLIAVTLLSGQVVKMTKDYLERKKNGMCI